MSVRRTVLVNWLLWWRVSDEEVDTQVKSYDKLKFYQSARGLAMVLLLAAALAISLTIFFGGWAPSGYVDVGVFGVLAVLIFEGYRWAMLAAMVAWTIEKVMFFFEPAGIATITLVILWWTTYMRVFWLAFRTETRRMASSSA